MTSLARDSRDNKNMFGRTHALAAVLLLCGAAAASSAQSAEPELAVVVDDLGYSLTSGRRVIALPGPLAVAVLPFTPNAVQLAELATRAGKEVILHQPMQADAAIHEPPGNLAVEMSAAEMRAQLAASLAELPQAIGVSNHTGSLLTASRGPMRVLMQALRAHGLFFLDSRTTAATVAENVAIESGVPALKRDVFLDNSLDREAIAQEFERALAIARRQGHAVLIAHPHDASLAFLETALPALSQRGIRQVAPTRLLAVRTAPPEPSPDRASLRTAPVR
jgi:polysaccharide deacetylase 2 family uncharacterized protein YibQ